VQLLMEQVKQLRQVGRDGEYTKKDYPSGMGAGRGNSERGYAGRGMNKNETERNYGGERPPIDMERIKCFRCEQMGHYARNCPKLAEKVMAREASSDASNEK
jgi:hypothetical protein